MRKPPRREPRALRARISNVAALDLDGELLDLLTNLFELRIDLQHAAEDAQRLGLLLFPFEDRADGSARIEQTIYVERESQRPIVLGKGGQTLKWIGQKAREELTELLDRPVHLFLTVKVLEMRRWR